MSFDRHGGSREGGGSAARERGAVGKRTLTEGLPIQRKVDVGLSMKEPDATPAAGGGRAMDPSTRGGMEAAFGADFSSVRIHEDMSPAALGAVAYTRGNDVHFAPGAYDPGGAAGKELLAHELTHVVQQRSGALATQGKGVADEPALEREADELAARVAQGGAAGPVSPARGDAVQRKETTLSVQVVTSAAARIEAINIAGRSESPFADTMGSHTTAWVLHCDHVRNILHNVTLPQAIGQLSALYLDVQRLPTYAATVDDPTLQGKFTGAMVAMATALQTAGELLADGADGGAARLQSLLQQAIGHYLSARNFMVGATVVAGRASGRAEGVSRANLSELDRFTLADQALPARRAIFELFDFPAALTARNAPGAPADPAARAALLFGQHLIDAREAYPHSFEISEISDPDVLRDLVAVAFANLGIDGTKAAAFTRTVLDVVDAHPPTKAHARTSGNWGVAKVAERGSINPVAMTTMGLAKILSLRVPLDAALLQPWKKLVVACAILDGLPEAPPAEKRVVDIRVVEAKAHLALDGVVTTALEAARAGATSGDLQRILTCSPALVDLLRPLLVGCAEADIGEALARYHDDIERLVAPLTETAENVAGIEGQQQYAAQISVGEDDTITDFAIGRPPSPFSNQGAHTTAWVTHEDELRNAVVGNTALVAVGNLAKIAASLLGGAGAAPATTLIDSLGPLRRAELDEAMDDLRGEAIHIARATLLGGGASLTDLQVFAQRIAAVQNLLPLSTLDLDADRGGKGERSIQKMRDESVDAAEDPAVRDGRVAEQIWKNFDWGQALQAVVDMVDGDAVDDAVEALVQSEALTREEADGLSEPERLAVHYDEHAPGLPAASEERLAVLLSQHRFSIDHAYPWLSSVDRDGRLVYPRAFATINSVDGLLMVLADKCPALVDLTVVFRRMQALHPIPGYGGGAIGAAPKPKKPDEKKAPKGGRKSARKQKEDDDAEWYE